MRKQKRYKLVSPKAQKEIISLSKKMSIVELADHFEVSYDTMAKKLIKLTGQKRKDFLQNYSDPKCNIDKANLICKQKGFKDALDYMDKNGRHDFILNIKPLLTQKL